MAATWTFNPGFYTDDELIERFCVRAAPLAELVSTSRAATPTNQHTLVVGPRGFGKTMLLRRFAAELRRDPELEPRWFPITFAEESYPVASAGELWLEALTHLADATGDVRWQKAYVELRRERDEARLRARALAQLLDFADERGRRLVLIVENVDKLLGGLPEADGWALRETLLHERRIQLVAAAPQGFEGVESPSQPFYELFRRVQLDPLGDAEIAALWKGTNGEDLAHGRAVALRILTGGNPRLVVLLATVAKGMPLQQLIDELAKLIDQHTNYFNANIEAITSPEMRRTFLALAEHWAPATARQVAEATRSDPSKASMLLGRLVDQGRVEVVRDGKTRTYQITERLYNIYYLMRKHGVHHQRLAYLVDFMAMFLEPRPDILARFAGEACDGDAERALIASLVEKLVKKAEPAAIVDFLKLVPGEYLEKHAPKGLKRKMKTPESLIALLGREDGGKWVGEAHMQLLRLTIDKGGQAAVELTLALAARLPPGPSDLRDSCGWALVRAGDMAVAMSVCPPHAGASPFLVSRWFAHLLGQARLREARPILDDVRELLLRAGPTEAGDREAVWATIAFVLAESGEFEAAMETATAHPSSQVFEGLSMRSTDRAALRELARRWVLTLPDTVAGWFVAYSVEDDEGRRTTARDRCLTLGPAATALGILYCDASEGRPALALDVLRSAPFAALEGADDELLTPALLLLARQLPAIDLVNAMRGTPASERLEPIYVALQRRAGEEPNAPREVLELADIVDQRIDAIRLPAPRM